jgi:hypothetical protein
MGLLKIFKKKKAPEPQVVPLPSGTFSVDPEGVILTSTLPQGFPAERARDIGQRVVATFKEARANAMPLTEIAVHYGAFKITARELRGGALIYLSASQRANPGLIQS